jgi:hypothetical protein
MSRARAAALIAVLVLAGLPWVLARHQLSLLTDLLIFGLFALSLDLIMGYTGLVSFGHAAYFGLGAYGSALVLIHFGQPVPVALLAGALLAGLVAVPVGWFSTRATGIYFAMLTLAFAQLLYTVAYKWRDLTGGSDGIAGVPKTALFWGGPSLASPRAFYFLVAACVLLSLAACYALVRSPFGRAIQAIRENERRFTSLGRDPGPSSWSSSSSRPCSPGSPERSSRHFAASPRRRSCSGSSRGRADDGHHGRHRHAHWSRRRGDGLHPHPGDPLQLHRALDDLHRRRLRPDGHLPAGRAGGNGPPARGAGVTPGGERG